MKAMRANIGVLASLLRGQPREGSAAERLEAFYQPQALHYDAFREGMLHGRGELMALLAPRAGCRVVELGCGTGRNLEFMGERIGQLASVEIVDLCPSLLERARARCRKWRNVRVIEADATAWRPAAPVDYVYLSYALSMMTDWRAAIENALAMLKPGGVIGIVDFYVAGRTPLSGSERHSSLARWFWPRWFAHDGVFLDPEHLPYLAARSLRMHLRQGRAALPYLAGLRAPYYVYVGANVKGRHP